MENTTKKTEIIKFRATPKYKARIKARAKRDRRSMTEWIERLIDEALK